MDKRFDPKSYEQAWQRRWAEAGYFRAEAPSEKPPFCIVIPPPNVTGKLHMGHALQSTLQDVLIRWRRMQGYNALWLPGTDHAGIATQIVVERQLAQRGQDPPRPRPREVRGARSGQWKEQYRRHTSASSSSALGASCDWTRERFTLDAGLSGPCARPSCASTRRGSSTAASYMVNWCPGAAAPRSPTSRWSTKTVQGSSTHIALPRGGRAPSGSSVATTRPETMLGDTAVAVHPEDERYTRPARQDACTLPLVDRRHPDHRRRVLVDPEFGTGAVKVTPAHDPNDYEVGQRHNLPKINSHRPRRHDQRERRRVSPGSTASRRARRWSRDLRRAGLVAGSKTHTHSVGQCQRSRRVVEPLISTQWFVKMQPLAEPAIAAVRDGRHRRSSRRTGPRSTSTGWEHPATGASRASSGGATASPSGTAAGRRASSCARRRRGRAAEVRRRTTLSRTRTCSTPGSSSALWPFSTLGWPDETPDLENSIPPACW